MKRTAILFGTEDSEHLRIEREGDNISFISHELRMGYGAQQSLWFDRPYATMSMEVLKKGLEEIEWGK